MGRHDSRIDAKEAAVRIAFEYVIRWNAAQHTDRARSILATAWCATVQVLPPEMLFAMACLFV